MIEEQYADNCARIASQWVTTHLLWYDLRRQVCGDLDLAEDHHLPHDA